MLHVPLSPHTDESGGLLRDGSRSYAYKSRLTRPFRDIHRLASRLHVDGLASRLYRHWLASVLRGNRLSCAMGVDWLPGRLSDDGWCSFGNNRDTSRNCTQRWAHGLLAYHGDRGLACRLRLNNSNRSTRPGTLLWRGYDCDPGGLTSLLQWDLRPWLDDCDLWPCRLTSDHGRNTNACRRYERRRLAGEDRLLNWCHRDVAGWHRLLG